MSETFDYKAIQKYCPKCGYPVEFPTLKEAVEQYQQGFSDGIEHALRIIKSLHHDKTSGQPETFDGPWNKALFSCQAKLQKEVKHGTV